MAVLQKIRNRAGLLIGALGLALLAFILSDLFSSSNTLFQKIKDKAFTVDGTVVSTGEYQSRIEEYETFHQFIYGQAASGETTAIQNREKVYRDMVDEMIVDEEAGRLGLVVTNKELSDLVYGTTVSSLFLYDQEISQIFRNPQTGQFDQGILIQFLQMIGGEMPTATAEQKVYLEQGKKAWIYIEKKIKSQRLKEKYLSLVGSAILVNNEEAKIAYNDTKTVANFSYVVQPYTSIADSSVTVSDSEIKTLYDKRKKNFKLASDFSTVSYFIKDVIPSDADYAAIKKEMDIVTEKLRETDNPATVVNEYSENSFVDAYFAQTSLSAEARNFVSSATVGDVVGPIISGQSYVTFKYIDRIVAPDSVRLQRIVIPGGFDKKIVSSIADSLLTVVKKGKSFAAVANELDPSIKDGEIGWLTEAQLASLDINKPVFEAAQGGIIKLDIRGETWLIRIAERTKPVTKVKLAVIMMAVIVSDRTQNIIDNELNQFISESGDSENFDKAAKAKGYGLVADVMMAPSFIGIDQMDGSTHNVISWIFNNEVGKVSKFDYTDKKIVAIIKSKIDGEYMPLSEPSMAKMLKEELIRDKKAEKIITALKSKNLTSLDAYAFAMEGQEEAVDYVSFDTRQLAFGYEPIFNIYAKHGNPGQLLAPLKGESGVYAISLTSKDENPKTFDEDEIKMRLTQESAYQLRQGTIYILRDKMNVKDNRIKFW